MHKCHFLLFCKKNTFKKKLLTFFIFLMDGTSLQNQLSTLRYPLTARCLKYFNLQKKNIQDICFFLLFMHKKHSTRPALRGVPIWRRRLFLTISFSANCSGQLYDRLPFFHSRQSPFSLLLQLLLASP